MVDSLGLLKTLATQTTLRDISSIYYIHSLRVDYERGVVNNIWWVPAKINSADILTKPHAGKAAGILEELLSTGRLPVYVNNLQNYGKAKMKEPKHRLPFASDVKGVLTEA